MVFVNTGRNKLALFMVAGSGLSFPRYCAIGSGSGTAIATNGSLVAEVGSRQDYSAIDSSIAKEVTWTHDYSSSFMSGMSLKEFGLFDTNVAKSGTMWHREGFAAVTFDGTNELQIQTTYQIF